MASEVLAQLASVRKSFGSVTALDGVDLEVRRGEVLALLGPNGAGKTTAVSLLTGLRSPDAGQARLFGREPTHPAVRRRLGVTPQSTGFPQTLRVREVVDFVARHYPSPRPVEEVLAEVELTDDARRQAGGLSGGQQRRLALALAFVGAPELVLLDEPTAGLDVEARRAVRARVQAYADAGGTVLLTSHDMADVEALATRVGVIDRGRLIANDTVERIRGLVDLKEVSFRTDDAAGVRQLTGVTRHERSGERHVLYSGDADQLVRDLVGAGVRFGDLEVRGASLEDAFLALTGRAGSGARQVREPGQKPVVGAPREPGQVPEPGAAWDDDERGEPRR